MLWAWRSALYPLGPSRAGGRREQTPKRSHQSPGSCWNAGESVKSPSRCLRQVSPSLGDTWGPGQRGGPGSQEKVPWRKRAVRPPGSPGPVFVRRAAGCGGSRHVGVGQGGWSSGGPGVPRTRARSCGARRAYSPGDLHRRLPPAETPLWGDQPSLPSPSWARSWGCEDVRLERRGTFVSLILPVGKLRC